MSSHSRAFVLCRFPEKGVTRNSAPRLSVAPLFLRGRDLMQAPGRVNRKSKLDDLATDTQNRMTFGVFDRAEDGRGILPTRVAKRAGVPAGKVVEGASGASVAEFVQDCSLELAVEVEGRERGVVHELLCLELRMIRMGSDGQRV